MGVSIQCVLSLGEDEPLMEVTLPWRGGNL